MANLLSCSLSSALEVNIELECKGAREQRQYQTTRMSNLHTIEPGVIPLPIEANSFYKNEIAKIDSLLASF
ncbi:MAG: hypothetical protein DRQ62_16195 [Gammaproteobacteria bacterium]|nr:MAG: hypothetical protein DRQ62_16195 [Gammaproteobacteria bacterium]